MHKNALFFITNLQKLLSAGGSALRTPASGQGRRQINFQGGPTEKKTKK